MLLNLSPYYKVLVIKIGLFNSELIDERHFSTKEAAESFANAITYNDSVSIVVAM